MSILCLVSFCFHRNQWYLWKIPLFQIRTWDKIQAIMKSEEGLGIEYDENVICDVCRSPDSEDGNEMVFCDSCNICVHQACYGITVIPDGTYDDGEWMAANCDRFALHYILFVLQGSGCADPAAMASGPPAFCVLTSVVL